MKIIDDDDYGHGHGDEVDESELFATNEEAPQIVGVIDERAPDVIMKQEYLESGKWKKIGASENQKKSEKQTKHRKRSHSDDESPPRKAKSSLPSREESSDNSPPRKKKNSSDESPPRRNKDKNGTPERAAVNKRRYSSDASPPRRSDFGRGGRRRSSDASLPRRTRKNSDSSPSRRSKRSPENKRRHSPDLSPPRQPSRQRRSRWSPEVKREVESPPMYIPNPDSPPRSSRMTKTLDGKVSGLQDAKTLKRENDAFKERQEKMFREMKPEVSGRHADIVIRDRRGRNKGFEQDVEGDQRKAEFEEARKKEYDRWGKGLKQIEDLERRYEEHMHEASKPLARMADDSDLQDHLRNQERLDDPMLQYIRKKKDDENKKKGVEEKPKYLGQFPDNRFNIRPGYRWDGVDRSNGYEKKYFGMINSKKSLEEEAYRYSTEDM